MGRKKLAYRKIENELSRRTTFCKRRYGLVKKAHELSILCDIDVIVVGFSEAGKFFQYCNQENIVDVVTKITNLPPSERTGQSYAAWNHILKSARQIKDKRNLESPTPVPTVGYFDLQCENKGLRETINKMNEEKTFWEQKERVYSGEAGLETITSIDHLAIIKGEFIECLQRLFERANQLKVEAQSSNPSHGSFGMAGVRPAQDQEFFPGRAPMGQLSHQEHNQPDSMGHQRAPTAENNYDSMMGLRCGKGVHNLNSGAAQIGETGQNSSSDTNVEFRPGPSAQTSNIGKTQIRETSPNFNNRTKRKSRPLQIGPQNFEHSTNITTNVKKLPPLRPRPSAQNSTYREREETGQYENTSGGRGSVHTQISPSSNQLDRGDRSAPSEQNM